jgi:hypothetical protein
MNALGSLVLKPVMLLTLAAADPAPAPAAATPVQSFHGRGVFYADAVTACPSVGIGTRSDHACLRIALDDEHSSADLDRANKRIVVRNDGTYAKETIVADVLLPGWSESAKERAPVSVHFVVWKKGDTFKTKTYSHVVNREKSTKLELEDLQIVLSDGKTEKVEVTDESARKAVRPSWRASSPRSPTTSRSPRRMPKRAIPSRPPTSPSRSAWGQRRRRRCARSSSATALTPRCG